MSIDQRGRRRRPRERGRRRSGRGGRHRHPSEGLSVKLAARPRWRGRRRAVQTRCRAIPRSSPIGPARRRRSCSRSPPRCRAGEARCPHRAERDGRRVGLDWPTRSEPAGRGDLQVAGIDLHVETADVASCRSRCEVPTALPCTVSDAAWTPARSRVASPAFRSTASAYGTPVPSVTFSGSDGPSRTGRRSPGRATGPPGGQGPGRASAARRPVP